MSLSNELISQFVKAAKEEKKTDTESTVYGTIVYDGRTYVQLDGSEILTPVETTADTVPGNRVTVMIKNHTATVTGNLSAPALNASSAVVQGLEYEVAEFDRIVANKVDTELMVAEQARIDALVADNVTIKQTLTATEAEVKTLKADNATIKGELKAAEADIEDLNTKKLDASDASITYATIENLNATNADVHNLEATYGEFQQLTANKLTAIDGSITRLQADKLDANTANITYAKITELEAVEADIESLDADVANIDTLIFGSASGNTIQSSFANAVIAQLGNAQIKSAMIEKIAAGKITSGDIVTDNVRVKSQNGLLLISDETIQISDNSRVRVQIGKDSSNDYSINVWDADGNLMFSKGGITDSAIKNAIIRNDMVSDTANIAAHKLDIDSLFEEINGSTNTIKSTQIHLDDKNQTLNVAFKNLETNVGNIDTTVKSQGTAISAVQGQISSKVWQQDIDTAKNAMTTQYSALDQKVDSFESTVSSTYATKTELSEINVGVRNLYVVRDSVEGFLSENGAGLDAMNSIRQEHTSDYIPVMEGESYIFQVWVTVDEADLDDPTLWMGYNFFDGNKSSITTRVTKRSMNILPNGQCYDIYRIDIPVGAEYIRVSARLYSDGLVKLEKGTVPTEWTQAPEDTAAMGVVAEITNNVVVIRQDMNGLQTSVSNTYATKAVLNDITNGITSIEEQINSVETTLTQQAESIELRATKTEVQTAKTEAISSANTNTTNLLKSYSTTTQMNSAIEQKANSITSSVTSTVNNLEIGGRNLITNGQLVQNQLKNGGEFTYENTKTGTTYIFSNLQLEPGNYTYSLYMKRSVDLDVARIRLFKNNVTVGYYTNNLTDGSWGIVKIPITVTSADDVYGSQIYNHNFGEAFDPSVSVKKIKLERGDKATDWSPAPEDMATADDNDKVNSAAEAAQETASNAETLIKQLADNISTLVTDGNGTSLMTQTEDGWTFSTADIQTAVSDAAEALSGLTDELGDANHTIDVLRQAVDDLGEIAEYVKIGTYEDEPCIELGESDSEFKMRITNTRILFMEGSNVVAHISNQSLHIKKAVIEEELQQGKFVWQIRSNGNLGLIWKG